MIAETRRNRILEVLKVSDSYITATSLAEQFGVTRQIIVSDIALLRANGYEISATRRGYFIDDSTKPQNLETVVCKHNASQILDEFYAIVDNGGSVVNVIVEHPLYGQISADLNINSRFEANKFNEQAAACNASQLSDLTEGVHIHTIRVENEEMFTRIKDDLRKLGILYEE